jgi:hypothetical protein
MRPVKTLTDSNQKNKPFSEGDINCAGLRTFISFYNHIFYH